MGFNLNEYETVDERIKRFYKDYPDGRIVTRLLSSIEDFERCRYKAYIFCGADDQDKNLPWATGHAFELSGNGYVNQTAHEENCETSAIGRALANAGYSTDKRPSREEMEKGRASDRNTAPASGGAGKTDTAARGDGSQAPSNNGKPPWEYTPKTPAGYARALRACYDALGQTEDTFKVSLAKRCGVDSTKKLTNEHLPALQAWFGKVQERARVAHQVQEQIPGAEPLVPNEGD